MSAAHAPEVRALDVRARLLAAILVVAALTASMRPAGLLLGLLCALLTWFLAGLSLSAAWRALRTPLPFLILLAVLQVFIVPGGDLLWTWRFVSVRSAGLLAAGVLLVRFSALVLVINLAARRMRDAEIVRGVEALLAPLGRIGFPVQDVTLVIQVTLNFLPYLYQTAGRIAQAQAARGADWDTPGRGLLERARQVLPFLVPLFLLTLRRAETLALAVEVRGFRSGARRTSLVELGFRRRDVGFLCLSAVLSLAVCLL